MTKCDFKIPKDTNIDETFHFLVNFNSKLETDTISYNQNVSYISIIEFPPALIPKVKKITADSGVFRFKVTDAILPALVLVTFNITMQSEFNDVDLQVIYNYNDLE
jgi:hypothetical protein